MNKFDDHRETVSLKCSRACSRRLLTVLGAGLLLLQFACFEEPTTVPGGNRDRPRPQPDANDIGACCLEPGVCIIEYFSICDAQGGWFYGADTECGEDMCLVIYDADFVPYPTGACCYGDADGEGCVESTFFDCDSTFLGAGTQCPASGNCDEILGACCDTNDGLCEQTTVEGCDLDSKVYQGDGTTCQDDGCDMTGACCSFDLCVFTNEEVCLSVGGEFLGVGVACEANTCVPTGACVLVLRAQCVILTEDECGAQFGIYSGDDTECG